MPRLALMVLALGNDTSVGARSRLPNTLGLRRDTISAFYLELPGTALLDRGELLLYLAEQLQRWRWERDLLALEKLLHPPSIDGGSEMPSFPGVCRPRKPVDHWHTSNPIAYHPDPQQQ